MVTLYVTSLVKGSGSTTVCAGLGQHLLEDGKKVGYLKVMSGDQGNTTGVSDSDAVFMKSILSMQEAIEQICPVFKDGVNFPSRAREALGQVSTGKDIVIVEGENNPEVAKALDARVIIVVTAIDSPWDKLASAGKSLGKRLLGVVMNKVSPSQVEMVRGQAKDALTSGGIGVLAVLPDDRTLFSLTVGEIVEHIQGEFLNNVEQTDELVKNLMLGAMTVDTGPLYYNLKTDKAVIIRSERPDMQLASLQTPTKCLILSGSHDPVVQVMNDAEDKKIPVIRSGDDVATIVSNIEEAFTGSKFNQAKKLPKLSGILKQDFDFASLYKGLSLTS